MEYLQQIHFPAPKSMFFWVCVLFFCHQFYRRFSQASFLLFCIHAYFSLCISSACSFRSWFWWCVACVNIVSSSSFRRCYCHCIYFVPLSLFYSPSRFHFALFIKIRFFQTDYNNFGWHLFIFDALSSYVWNVHDSYIDWYGICNTMPH